MADLNFALAIPANLNPTGVRVRVAGTWEEPLFCLVDVCNVLGIVNSRDVAATLLDEQKYTVGSTDGVDVSTYPTYVDESAFYQVLIQSRKSEAAAFVRWVTKDVLPCIRKHGCYPAPENGAHNLRIETWGRRFRETFAPHVRYISQHIPGYFSVVSGLTPDILAIEDEFHRHNIPTHHLDRPDISVGRTWSDYRRTLKLEPTVLQAPLLLPKQDRGQDMNVWVKVYAGDEWMTFMTWFRRVYVPERFINYLDNKKELRVFAPVTKASIAENFSMTMTGLPAALKAKPRADLEAAGGFAPAPPLPAGLPAKRK